MAIGDELVLTAGPAQGGMFVACVGSDALAGGDLDNGRPDGDEQFGFVAFAELVVDAGESLTRGFAVLQVRFDQHA